jgi:hypothetical protein
MNFQLISNGERSVICPVYMLEDFKGFTPRSKPVAAKSWLAAKLAMGFELTPLQTRLLGEQS